MNYPEPCVGAVIVRDDGKILLATSPKWHGEWIIAGGHVDIGETIAHALKREIKEELNIEVEPVRLLKVQDFINDPSFHEKKHFIFLDFLCRYVSGEVKVDGRELTEYQWIAPEESLKINIDGYTRKVVEAYLSELPCYDYESRKPE